MSKSLLIFASFFIIHHSINCQEIHKKISIQSENASLKNTLELIEIKTGYKFFYIDQWINNKTITKNYIDKSIDFILSDLFNKTLINYYIILKEKRIILTKNNTIYDNFSFNSLRENKKNQDITLLKEKVNIDFLKNNNTIKVGKATRSSKKSRFSIKGLIKNSKNNLPISDMVVLVKNTNIHTTSNIDGFYSLTLKKGKYTIQTKRLGFDDSSFDIMIYGNGKHDIYVSENTELLNEVNISSNKDINIKKEITGLTQIKIKEIKTVPLVLGEKDILKVSTTLPGIKKAGEGSSGYNVRGGKIDQNLILLDDGLIYNPNHFFGLFSAINPFTINGIDIYKGAIPAKYGGRLSSVFDIKVKNPNPNKLSGEGSIGPVTGNLALEIPVIKEKASLLLGVRSAYSNWILKKLDNVNLKNSKASFYDGILKYHHKVNSKNTIKLLGYYSKDNFNITKDSLYNYSNSLISLAWNKKLNPKNNASITLSKTIYNFNIKYNGAPKQRFNLGYDIDETSLKLNFRYKKNKKYKFYYGISGKLYSISPGTKIPDDSLSLVAKTEIPKERGVESSIYLSSNISLNNKLSLDAGFRYSAFTALGPSIQSIYQNDEPISVESLIDTKTYKKNKIINTYSNPEFRIALRYLMKPNFSLKASYNSMYQYIHTLSNNTTASPTDTWKLSDLNIKPQFSNQFSLGVYKNFKNNMFEASLESYYKRTTNVLDYKIGSELFLNKSIETEVLQGKGKSYGIEFLIRKNKGKFNGWLSYSYSRSLVKFDSKFTQEQINNGQFFSSNFDKPHDLSLITNYKLTKRFSFSANFSYQTGRPITYPVGKYSLNGNEFVLYSDRNKFRIPDYYRLDLGFNIEGNHKLKKLAHSFWNISVYNVLGRNNPYSVFFVTEDQKIKAYKSSIFSIPIPTITYNFKF